MENYNEKENKNLKLCVMICFILFSIFAGLYSRSIVYAQNASQTQQVQQKKLDTIYISEEKLQYGFEFTKRMASKNNLNPDRTADAYLTGCYYTFHVGGYSLKKLYWQLKQHKFTHEEIIMGLACLKTCLKLDFSEQAYISAKRYVNILTTNEILEKRLAIDGYEKEEIKYAIEKIKLDILQHKIQKGVIK